MAPLATTAEVLKTALHQQQAGHLDAAEQSYRQILAREPDFVDALNLLGALLYQQHRYDEAIAQFRRVLTLQPESPDAYNSVGIVLKAQGHLEEAITCYNQTLSRQPDHAEAHNNLGNALKDLGRLEEAISAYRQALKIRPAYPEAYNNLGVALRQQGQWQAAMTAYQQAIGLRPNYFEAHQNLGSMLQAEGKPQEAITYYRQALALKPHPELYNSLGNLLQRQNDLEGAIAAHQQAIALKPDFAEAHHALGNALQQQKQIAAAIAAYKTALELRSHYPEAWNNLGNALQEEGKFAEAIAHYQKALELRPDFAEAHSNLGAALKDQQQLDQGIVHLKRALELRPDYAEVHNNLGNAYQEKGEIETAIFHYREALRINPKFAEIHSNLGNMLQQLGRFSEAFEHFQQAIAAQPAYAGAYNNLGIALRNSGQVEAAIEAYRQAIALDPDFVEARWNLALNQLFQGDLKAGFAGYEWRFEWSKFKQQNPPRLYSQPRWDGAPLEGKTIFLYAEQGMGDAIQFVRYLPLVAQRGGRILLECHAPLLNLFRGMPEIAQLIPQQTAPPAFDLHAPLLSLPYIFGTSLETVPAIVPYLAAPPPTDPIPGPPGDFLKIGIVWSGNPQNPYNQTRACPPELLLQLADLPGVQIYSLQKDLRSPELEVLQAHPQVTDLRPWLIDFVATAGILQQLDRVITVDTAVAHLAGALGKSVWLLLPFAPDWRWLQERPDSPWYPTMRLFRQKTYGDWAGVLQEVRQALASETSSTIPQLRQGRRKQKHPRKSPAAPASTPVATPLPAAPAPLPAELKTALQHYREGRSQEAVDLCQQLIQAGRAEPEIWHLLGLIAHQDRQFEQAIDHYRRVLALQSHHHDIYNNLGVVFQEQGHLTEAIAHYEKSLALKPDYPDAHNNYANALREQGHLDRAIDHYRRAVELRPDYADAHNNLGLALFAQGEFEQAAAAYQQALVCRPDYPQAHNHLGNALKELGDFDRAIVHYQRAIALQPDYAKAYNNWGNVYRDRGDLATARQYYDRAIGLQADFAEAHWNKALTLLLGGDLQPGFAEYEWRWRVKMPNFYPLRPFPRPLWDGSELNGQTIFLHAEQGMGDILQFVRYVPIVQQRGGRVILECHPPLINLFRQIPGLKALVAYGATPPSFDLQAPLLSLPHILGTTLETIPAQVPYLPLPQALPLPERAAFNVGIVWSGNPKNPYNRSRAIPLELLLQLTNVPGLRLYSLQKDLLPAEQALLQAHPELVDLSPQLQDFVQTAALIQGMDLVIAVDTAVAHLAGALGKPVWLLLPYAPDWRWMLERQDTPWYPTMRLFRQPAPGAWEPVLEQVQQALVEASGQPVAAFSADLAISLEQILQLYQAGDLARSEQLCRQLLVQQPDQLEALHALGVILCRSDRSDQAISYLQRVLELQPDFAEAWGNLGGAFQAQNQLDLAIAHYGQAIALQPDYADAHYNLALALQERDRLEEALHHCQRAIDLAPNNASAYYNRGFILRRLGQLPAAIASYRQAIGLRPTYVEAHKNLGHALLLSGDLIPGFAEYEWRWQQPGWVSRAFTQPQWDGSDLNGKTILLHAEQGYGDTIQFIRYASLVKALGGPVIVECQPALLELLQTAPGIDRLIAQDAPLPEFDCHAPLLSLPHILQTRLETIPAPIPYLRSSGPALSPCNLPSSGFKVGIVWTGNPEHKNNHHRSCPIAQFKELVTIPGVSLYSLQKGAAEADLEGIDFAVTDLSPTLENFAATAAVIAQLDLVITIDTAVAHLAGAMGKPVWLLLSFAPDWRWMLERQDTPWYPTMRLFRQSRRGDWSGVFGAVRQALLEVVQPPARSSVGQQSQGQQSQGTIGLTWPLDLLSEPGILGTHLLLHQGQQSFSLTAALPDSPLLPPYQARLEVALRSAETTAAGFLHLLGNHLEPIHSAENLEGRRFGYVQLTDPDLSATALTRGRSYAALITGSDWSRGILQSSGLETVHTLAAGIDPGIFHPAPKTGWFGDRYIIFSGGDGSYRQGQDILLKAFGLFWQRCPEALLLTTWELPASERQNFPEEAIVCLGPLAYPLWGQVLREATVAVFPDRCQSGSNPLVLGSLACGVPTVLSANTGHLDLLRHNLGYGLQVQRLVRSEAGRPGWGESDVEELLEIWERIYTSPQEARHRGMTAAEFIQTWTWEKVAHQVAAILRQADD